MKEDVRRVVEHLTDLQFTVTRHGEAYYEVVVHADAKRALELESKLAEVLPDTRIIVRWTGEMNVSEEELADHLVRMLVKLGLRARALQGFDAVRAVREGRDRFLD